MTHLHIPDGVLPVWLWVAGFGVALVLVGIASYLHRQDRADRLTLLGALSALMLTTMAVPLGPVGHLNLAAVVGILLGPGLGFVAAMLVNGILALLGHGGLTVVGLNSVILGAGTALAQPAYRALRRHQAPGRAAAFTAVASLAASALVLYAVIALSARPGLFTPAAPGASAATGRFVLFSLPFWLIGAAGETLVTAGLISFLARVKPELLPSEVSHDQ